MIRLVIVRVIRRLADGSVSPGPREAAAETGEARRGRFARAAARVNGLETLVLGWHTPRTDGGSADAPSVVMIAWRDVESMLNASARDEARFLRDRLGLSM